LVLTRNVANFNHFDQLSPGAGVLLCRRVPAPGVPAVV